MSTIMSIWPPTRPRRPISCGIERTSRLYVAEAARRVGGNWNRPPRGQGERVAVHLDRSVHQRSDQLVGGVLEREQICPLLPSLQRGHCDERLARAGPDPGAESGQGGVHRETPSSTDALLD